MANAEQLGANRHVAGIPGASTRRYVLSSVISARAIGRGRGLSPAGGQLEGSYELRSRLRIGEGVRTGLRDHEHVARRLDIAAARAKNLAQQPLDAAADHRVPDPLAHRDAETGAQPRGRAADHHQVFAVPTAPLALHGEELGTPTQANRLRVAVRGGHGSPRLLRWNRDRQAPAPLVAPPLQDAASAGRSHSGAEAMRSFAPAVARLIGPLHRSPGWAREPAIRTQHCGNVNFAARKVLASFDRMTPPLSSSQSRVLPPRPTSPPSPHAYPNVGSDHDENKPNRILP